MRASISTAVVTIVTSPICGDEEAGEDKVPVAQALPQRLLEVIAMTADISDRHGLSRGIPRGRGA